MKEYADSELEFLLETSLLFIFFFELFILYSHQLGMSNFDSMCYRYLLNIEHYYSQLLLKISEDL